VRTAARAFQRAETGVAAVEFSLILPILVVLWIGGVEVTGALSVDRRLNNLTSAVGDLVARDKQLTFAEVDQIFDIAPAAMFPYTTTGLSVRVSAVNIDAARRATVAWSRAEGSKTAYAAGFGVNNLIAENLRVPNSQIIMSEVYHTYRPTVGYVISGDLELDDRMLFVPRLVAAVALCDNAGKNCKS
jgi:Flp pilus assembly protein TadG